MRPNPRLFSLAGLAVGAALIAAACSSAAATSAPVITPAAAVAGATSTPAPQSAAFTIGMTNDPALGSYLTGKNGMTLYVLLKDSPDTSTCSGSCATTWPPLTVPAGAMVEVPAGGTSPVATTNRADGTVQVTYNHMPLYYFSGDSAAGDHNGQGKLNVWFVAPLSGTVTTPAPSAAAPSAAPTVAGY